MTVKEVADRLVALCREGNWAQAQDELYHPNIISREPKETGGEVTQGLEGIQKKNETWDEMAQEVHNQEISDPMIADGYFACTMTMDVTLKEVGRIQSTEICVYKVADGKIVEEQFFHQ